MFVIFLLAYVLARGMLRPILLLSEGAQRVSAGDLDVHLPVHGRDELADLTSAFNEMARRVRDSRDELAESATALARTNDQLEQAKERFRSQAITDALTGIFNRRHFEDCLDEQIARAAEEGKPLSLLLLDLDHFKQFNDRWGHTEGDAELRRVAALVQRTVRSTDIAFRYGGEELAVLLPACSKEQAMVVAEKVRIAVGSGTQRPSRFGARTTVSAGVATYPEDGRVARGLVDTADAALYQAKAQGRDRVVAAGGPSSTVRRTESARRARAPSYSTRRLRIQPTTSPWLHLRPAAADGQRVERRALRDRGQHGRAGGRRLAQVRRGRLDDTGGPRRRAFVVGTRLVHLDDEVLRLGREEDRRAEVVLLEQLLGLDERLLRARDVRRAAASPSARRSRMRASAIAEAASARVSRPFSRAFVRMSSVSVTSSSRRRTAFSSSRRRFSSSARRARVSSRRTSSGCRRRAPAPARHSAPRSARGAPPTRPSPPPGRRRPCARDQVAPPRAARPRRA